MIKRGRVRFVNEAGVRLMLFASADDLVGRPIADFVVPGSIPRMAGGFAALREVGDRTPWYSAEMIRADGTVVQVEVVAVVTLWDGEPALQVITRDVSARHAAETALKSQAALVNHVSDAIIGTTAQGVVTSWNPAAHTIYGWSVEEALGRSISELLGAAVDPVAVVASGGIAHATHRSAEGAIRDVRVSVAAMANGYVFVCCDLTPLRRAEQHFEAVVATMAEGVLVTDKDGRIKSINPAAVQIMGTGPEHLGGDFFEITRHYPFFDADGVDIAPDDRPALAVLRTGVPFSNQVFGFDRRGDRRVWVMSSCRLLNPDMPGQSDMLISFTDITAERKVADKVLFYATHDALTSLPNRASVLRKINRTIALEDEQSPLRAVLFIDIDDLKTVNDTMGHTAGDELLRATADCLRRAAVDGDVAGRLGGDEFVMLVCRDVTSEQLDEMVERLRAELAQSASPAIHASIGVVEVRRDDRRTADEILRDADLAMYEAKRAGRSPRSEPSTSAD